MGCYAVWTGRCVPRFSEGPAASVIRVEETSVHFYRNTQRHITEDGNFCGVIPLVSGVPLHPVYKKICYFNKQIFQTSRNECVFTLAADWVMYDFISVSILTMLCIWSFFTDIRLQEEKCVKCALLKVKRKLWNITPLLKFIIIIYYLELLTKFVYLPVLTLLTVISTPPGRHVRMH